MSDKSIVTNSVPQNKTYTQKLDEAIADRRKLMEALEALGSDTLHTFYANNVRVTLNDAIAKLDETIARNRRLSALAAPQPAAAPQPPAPVDDDDNVLALAWWQGAGEGAYDDVCDMNLSFEHITRQYIAGEFPKQPGDWTSQQARDAFKQGWEHAAQRNAPPAPAQPQRLTAAQRRALEVVAKNPDGIAYLHSYVCHANTVKALLKRGLIEDYTPMNEWEQYRITPAGRRALEVK